MCLPLSNTNDWQLHSLFDCLRWRGKNLAMSFLVRRRLQQVTGCTYDSDDDDAAEVSLTSRREKSVRENVQNDGLARRKW